jgi:protein subunit release factor B
MLRRVPLALQFARQFSGSAAVQIKRNQLPPRPKVSDDEIEEVFIKGGGKGGQKINKTNSKVQLRHVPTGIVVSCQHSRSREQNRAKAREILAGKVEEETAPEGESRAAIVAKYKQNKARKKKSRSRKKYARLEEEKKKGLEESETEKPTN